MHGNDGINNQGIIPRTIQTLFQLTEQSLSSSSKIKSTFSISCLEIYQEKLFDLLNENISKSSNTTTDIPLRIRQTSIGSVWVEVYSNYQLHLFILLICNNQIFIICRV